MIVAAAQFAPVAGDVEANVLAVSRLVRRAGAEDARVVVFPELALTGYEPTLIGGTPAVWLTEGDARLDPVREACRAARVAAVVSGPVVAAVGVGVGPGGAVGSAVGVGVDGEVLRGSVEARPRIASLVIGADGALLARYDKRHLYGLEAEVFAAGAADGRFALDGVRFGLATCYDNRFPDVAERAARDGCAVYLASSALDVGNDSFEEVYPVRAKDFGLYVALANFVGPSEAGLCAGRSGVWGPDGVRIADVGPDREGLALAEVG